MTVELQRAIIEGEITADQKEPFEVKASVAVPEKIIYLNAHPGIHLRLFKENRRQVHTMGVAAREDNSSFLTPHYPRELVEYVKWLKPRIVWLEDERIFKQELPNSLDPAWEFINQYRAMFLDLGTPFRERWNDLPTLHPDDFKARS